MISLQKGFLFVHIPKTAGNSIQSILRRYSEDEIVVSPKRPQDGVERFGLRNAEFGTRKHSSLAEYRAALGPERFDSLFKFSCVRNPWDRMISYYFTPTRRTAEWDRKEFEKFVRKTSPAAEFLRLNRSDRDPFNNVDRVLRFENITEEFQSVCQHLGLEGEPLPVYNRSKREDYRTYYDDKLRNLVAKRFASEIERFGYTFE